MRLLFDRFRLPVTGICVKENVIRRYLVGLIILYALLALLIIPRLGCIVFSDDLSYLDNSRLLSRGDLSGFTGYWSPVYTAFLIPVHWLPVNPIIGVKYINLLLGAIWIALTYVAACRFGCGKPYALVAAFLTAMYMLTWVPLQTTTPDLLVAIHVMILAMAYHKPFLRRAPAAANGLLCGLGMLVKSYCLVYGIAGYILLAVIRKLSWRNLIGFSLGVSLVVIPWKMMFPNNSVMKYNLYYLWEQRQNQNDWGDSFMEPEGSRTHFWSNPVTFSGSLPLRVSASGIAAAVIDNGRRYWSLQFLKFAGLTWPLVLLLIIRRRLLDPAMKFLLAAILLYQAGYLFLNIEERYLFASLGLEMILLVILFGIDGSQPGIRKLMPVIMLLWPLTVTLPSNLLNLNHPLIAYHQAIQELSREIKLDRNLVSDNALFGFELAFLEGVKSYNVVPVSRLEEYQEIVTHHNIGYYLHIDSWPLSGLPVTATIVYQRLYPDFTVSLMQLR